MRNTSFAPIAAEHISYIKAGDRATVMPSVERFTGSGQSEYIKYKYDECGNISEVHRNGKLYARYAYDKLNRLIREDNKEFGKTQTFAYDNNGNILRKSTYAFTLRDTEQLAELTCTDTEYTYDGDELTYYGNEQIGNYKYRGKNIMRDRGRILIFGDQLYEYDGFGRITKEGNTEYTYDSNGNLIKQSDGTDTLYFIYDDKELTAVCYGNATYYYRRNIQGDITALLDRDGHTVVKYFYDAWGNGKFNFYTSDGYELAELNPFRYRGYYYDTKQKLYYLKTRYYDPEIGRFISMDDVENIDPTTINGFNLYAYCGNNPVMNVDPNGAKWWKKVFGWISVGTMALLSVGTIIAGGFLVATGAGFQLGATLIGAGVGGLTGIGMSIYSQGGFGSADPWRVAGAGLVGGAIGASIGFTLGALGVAVGASSGYGGLAMAGGGVVSIAAVREVALALAISGLIVLFAKDSFIKQMERDMTPNQRQHFKEEIEDWKYGEGRGGADNLTKSIIRKIAETVKKWFK